MKITKKCEYALRTLLALAQVYDEGKTLNLREISEAEKLPIKFLEQIMIVLKRSGIVRSEQGKFGGYALQTSPRQMTLGEIIRAVEGPISPIGTKKEIQRRIEKGGRSAGLYSVLLDVRNAIGEILDKKTLWDVLERSQELAQTKRSYPMYYI